MSSLLMPEGDQLLRIKNVAVCLDVSEKTVRRWIESGKIVSLKMGGLRVIPKREFDAFLQRLRGIGGQNV